ncbi:hypothetical protein, partial [Pseudomonas helleri]
YQDRYTECLAQLHADSHWSQLGEQQKSDILGKRKLLTLVQPVLNDADAIVDSLNDVSLEQWSDRTESLASKFDSARMEAVQL